MSRTVITNRIGSVFIHATVTEVINTKLRRSKYVVERGVDITDHASVEPTEIILNGKISNHDVNSRSYNAGLISQEYAQLVNYQKNITFLSIFTGMSIHQNMVIDELKRNRVNKFGQVMEFTAILREWRFAENPEIVSAIAVNGGSNGSANSGAASGNSSTSPDSGTEDAGNSQVEPVEDNSFLFEAINRI